jgi:pimeloyl-ACP methyl ester carboxylesterase
MPEVTQHLFLEAPTLEPLVAIRRFVEAAVGFSAPTALVDQVYAHRLAHPPDPDGWQAQAAAGMAWDAFDRVSGIRAPTLVITGTEDNVVDARNSDLLADRIPNARLVKLDGAGHMLFWERADDFVDVVEEFLA